MQIFTLTFFVPFAKILDNTQLNGFLSILIYVLANVFSYLANAKFLDLLHCLACWESNRINRESGIDLGAHTHRNAAVKFA
jgi:hypothetical protein